MNQSSFESGGVTKCTSVSDLFFITQTPANVIQVEKSSGAVSESSYARLDGPVANTSQRLHSLTCGRGDTLFVATEHPLERDGPAAAAGQVGAVRILTIDAAAAGQAAAIRRTTRYTLEGLDNNGLVDVQTLGTPDSLVSLDDAVLTLERSGTVSAGYRTQIFETHLDSSPDVSDCDSLAGANGCSAAAGAASKTLLADLADLGWCSRRDVGETAALCALQNPPGTWTALPVGNFMAMGIGPRIDDGRRTLLLTSHDYHDAVEGGTRFVLLALDEDVEEAGERFKSLDSEDDELLVWMFAILFCCFAAIVWKAYSVNKEPERQLEAERPLGKPPSEDVSQNPLDGGPIGGMD